jgi:hypothetical protein
MTIRMVHTGIQSEQHKHSSTPSGAWCSSGTRDRPSGGTGEHGNCTCGDVGRPSEGQVTPGHNDAGAGRTDTGVGSAGTGD